MFREAFIFEMLFKYVFFSKRGSEISSQNEFLRPLSPKSKFFM